MEFHTSTYIHNIRSKIVKNRNNSSLESNLPCLYVWAYFYITTRENMRALKVVHYITHLHKKLISSCCRTYTRFYPNRSSTRQKTCGYAYCAYVCMHRCLLDDDDHDIKTHNILQKLMSMWLVPRTIWNAFLVCCVLCVMSYYACKAVMQINSFHHRRSTRHHKKLN